MKKILMKVIFITLFIPLFSYAQDLRVEPETLLKDLNAYKIIDARTFEEYSKSHIKEALSFPADLSYANKNINGKVVSPSNLQKIARELGLNIDDKIVIYDNSTFFDAARLFWTLEVYGFKNVRLLNANFNEWKTRNFPISNEIKKVKHSDYVASINTKRISTKFTTQIATKNPNHTIVDARAYEAYIGKKSSAKRFGHIPKAINIPAVHNLNNQDAGVKLKNISQLDKLYKGLEKNKKIVIYCAIGKVASTNYFALRELGYNVSNYDASWKEWGNDFSLPIITKTGN